MLCPSLGLVQLVEARNRAAVQYLWLSWPAEEGDLPGVLVLVFLGVERGRLVYVMLAYVPALEFLRLDLRSLGMALLGRDLAVDEIQPTQVWLQSCLPLLLFDLELQAFEKLCLAFQGLSCLLRCVGGCCVVLECGKSRHRVLFLVQHILREVLEPRLPLRNLL